jgi:PAS domain S-box-containing protein
MSWVTILWSMNASACLTLAAIYFLVWWKRRKAWDILFLTLSSAAVAVYTGLELWMLRAETPAQFATALRWIQLPVWVLIVSLVAFVRLRLRAGRPWLAWTICALRTLALLINFLVGQNLNFRVVTHLHHIPFLGESASIADGVHNPWMLVSQLSLLLFVIFTADAALSVWRRGDRRQALATCGSILLFAVTAILLSLLVLWHLVDWPLTASFCFLGIIATMGYEMSYETLRAAQLADDLGESEERMTLASAAAGFGVWMWSIARNEVWASERWRTLFGFAPDAAVTFEKVIERIHLDDREIVEREVRRAVTDRKEFMAEYRIVLPDRTQRWVLARGKVYADSNGKPVRMLGATIEITQRKEAESALRESNERFRLVVEASPSGIVLVDEKGRMTLVNAQIQKLFGYTREELVGQAVDLLVPDRFRAGHEVHRANFHQAPAPRMMGQGRELFGRRKDGSEFPLEIGLSSVQGPEGILVLAAVVDVSARKQSEAEASRQRAELAHVARVSTMGELAASVAHELNQPLGAILANAEAAELFLQQDPPAHGELRAILADIRQDDERAGEVIRRMRALLRKRELDQQPLEINSVVTDVLHVVSGDAALRKTAISADLAPLLPKILGDRVHLQQVLLNLILNGMDAMAEQPRERRRLSVRTRPGTDGLVELVVTDLGHGIEPDKLPNLFEPFYTTKTNGMGMGLSIARRIIEAHRGRIWAENNGSGGAAFHVTLPVVQDERTDH